MGDGRQLQLLAGVLVAFGVELTVVGSVGRALNGECVRPNDLDLAIEDTIENRYALEDALDIIGARRTRVDRYDTPFGPVDVFFGRRSNLAHASIAGVDVKYFA